MAGHTVVTTDEFTEWFVELSAAEKRSVGFLIELLEQQWLRLPYPYSSAIRASKYAFRELRSKQKGLPLRIIYCFSPERNAVLIIGGNKAGNHRFYDQIIAQAERIWERYLASLEEI